MPFPSTFVKDAFNRANGAAGAAWTALFGDTALTIASNAVQSQAGWSGGYWNGESFYPDSEVFATYAVNFGAAVAGQPNLYLRLINPTLSTISGYCLSYTPSTHKLDLQRTDSGTGTTLVATTTVTLAAGDKIGVRARGSTIEGWYGPAGAWQAAPLLTGTDATYPAAGFAGIEFSDVAGGVAADDFGAGNMPSRRMPVRDQAVMRAATR